MEYDIIEGLDFDDLVEKVDLALQDGWIPQGGVCYDPKLNYNGEVFAQAVVRVVE